LYFVFVTLTKNIFNLSPSKTYSRKLAATSQPILNISLHTFELENRTTRS